MGCLLSTADSGIHFREFKEAALAIHYHMKTTLQHPKQTLCTIKFYDFAIATV